MCVYGEACTYSSFILLSGLGYASGTYWTYSIAIEISRPLHCPQLKCRENMSAWNFSTFAADLARIERINAGMNEMSTSIRQRCGICCRKYWNRLHIYYRCVGMCVCVHIIVSSIALLHWFPEMQWYLQIFYIQ